MNHGRKDKIFGCRTRGVPRHNIGKAGKGEKDYDLLRSGVTNSDGNDVADTSPTFKVLEEGAATLSKEEYRSFGTTPDEVYPELAGGIDPD